MGVALMDLRILNKEFKKLNTVRGRATKTETLERLGVTVAPVKTANYKMVNGVPHTFKNGAWVAMVKRG